MSEQLLKKTIGVVEANLDDRGNIKIKDTDGKTFTINKVNFTTKETSVAFKQATEIGNLLGGSFDIMYDEKPMTKGNGYFRNIRAIYRAKGVQAPISTPNENIPSRNLGQTRTYGASVASQGALNRQPDWDKIAQGKVRHGVAIAFIEKGAKLTEETKKEINAWTDFIMSGDGIEEPAPMPDDEPSRFNEDAYPADGNDMADKMDIPF